MARLYLKRTLTGFAPADEPSAEVAKRYKVGDIYRADIVKPRSYQHHKLCMALLSLTYENLPESYSTRWRSFDEFRRAVALAAGHTREYATVDGEIVREADSLSYDRLDEVQFGKVMPKLMDVCCALLRIEAPELEAEVSRYASDHYGMAA